LTSLRRPAEALAAWDRAIELARSDDERVHSLRTSRALVLVYLGQIGQALDDVATIPKTGPDAGLIHYNDACIFAAAAAAAPQDVARTPAERASLAERYTARALAALTEAGRAGYFRDPAKVPHLRADRDFDSLRSRADFQLLMMDLAMPDDPFAR
jgi:hypothetical protein